MPSVGVVGGDHEGPLHCLVICFLGAALGEGNALQHVGEERAAGSLLGLRACLLVVEEGEHTCGVGNLRRSREHGLHSRPAHRQVVETAGGDKLTVRAEGASWRGIGKVKVEVEYVFLLDIQLISNHVHQEVALFHFIVDDAEDWQHVLLPAQLHSIVHLAVEVDGEVAYL